MISYKEYAKIAKKKKDTWFNTHILRKISTRLSWILINIFPEVSPNKITILSGFLGILGALLLISPEYSIIGAIVLISWTFLDGVDGEIARFKKQTSMLGSFLDNTFDHAILTLIFWTYGLRLLFTDNFKSWGIVSTTVGYVFLLSRLSIGLRAENLVKKDIGITKLGGMPKKELEKIKQRNKSPIMLIGYYITHFYDTLIRNYVIVYIFSGAIILSSYIPEISLMNRKAPTILFPFIIYWLLIPVGIAIMVGVAINVKDIEERILRGEKT